MPNVFVSTVVNAPIERVWRTVGDFNGLPAWMPGMKASTIEGGVDAKSIGAVRSLSMATGDQLRERLEEYSKDDRRIVYSVLPGPLPLKNVRTGMQLRPITDTHGTLVEWFSSFETEPGKEGEGVAFLRGVFNSGLRALKRHLGV